MAVRVIDVVSPDHDRACVKGRVMPPAGLINRLRYTFHCEPRDNRKLVKREHERWISHSWWSNTRIVMGW